ncbi:hypothetical protein PENSTE_c021G03971 [Penicillium steckii]|uniref:Uncharacterized protein n=1 Tax=Penicillium steckii TaxID=303698 RepID=A0A1V6SUL7_9EURO|nr:hypothetical protein PENSTE_c021G03971 [Penicillium steckii]
MDVIEDFDVRELSTSNLLGTLHSVMDRPSTQEIYTMARLIRSEMPEENCDFNFPQLALIFDHSHKCRILQSFFDGRLHVLFSEILSFEQFIILDSEVENEDSYFDIVDREAYLKKLNIILKWIWPVVREVTDMEEQKECFMER